MKLIVLSKSDDYTVSGLIRYLIKMFYKESIIEIFDKRGIEIVTSKYIRDVIGKDEDVFLQELDPNEDCIILGIHPYGWRKAIDFGGSHTKVMWQDDLHYFSNYIDRKGVSVQRYSEKYDPPFIGRVDSLITPSSIYFKNLGIVEYDEKISDFFYFLDESIYDSIGIDGFFDRIEMVVLSGEVASGYDSRLEFDMLRQKKSFDGLIHKIPHPGYKDNEHMTEGRYYRELSKYRGAFVGHYVFPINFLLAKHIEVLMCGCLGFFEPNPLLEKQLGLIEYVHYVPCFENGALIKDDKFYRDWISSKEGEAIANRGKEYVRENFRNRYVEKLADYLSGLKGQAS